MRIIDCQLRSLSGRAPIRPDLKGEPSMSDRGKTFVTDVDGSLAG
jgi:hypothetical protein